MILNNIKNNKDRGFTIVELLIVIVIIGILAAITIVSYTGITTRANASKTVANAQSIQQVIEALGADNSSTYPTTTAGITSPATTAPTKLPTGIVLQTTAPTSATGTTNFQMYTSTTAGATLGGRIVFWDYNKNNLCTSTTGNANGSTTDSCVFWGAAKSSDTFAVFAS